MDHILAPYLESLIGRSIPGLGLAATIVLVLLAGLFGTNVLGKHLLAYFDRGLSRVPVVAGIYTSTKQFMEAIGTTNTKSFKRVVLVEFPRKGLLTLGFVTRDVYVITGKDGTRHEVLNVFVPHSPNPVTGFILVVQKSQVIGVDLSVEEGVKIIVSAGIITPARTYSMDDTGAMMDAARQEWLPGDSAAGGAPAGGPEKSAG